MLGVQSPSPSKQDAMFSVHLLLELPQYLIPHWAGVVFEYIKNQPNDNFWGKLH